MSSLATRSTRERGGAGHTPWVTVALVAICVCVYSLTQYEIRQAQVMAEQRLQGAITYFIEHPYLEPGPILAERIDAGTIELRRRSERMSRTRRGAPVIP